MIAEEKVHVSLLKNKEDVPVAAAEFVRSDVFLEYQKGIDVRCSIYQKQTHSLKVFRTQMSTAKLNLEIINYLMGHTVDTYEDVQSLGVETLRNLYTSAALAIRPQNTGKQK